MAARPISYGLGTIVPIGVATRGLPGPRLFDATIEHVCCAPVWEAVHLRGPLGAADARKDHASGKSGARWNRTTDLILIRDAL